MRKCGLLQWRFEGSLLPLFGYDREGDLWGKLSQVIKQASQAPLEVLAVGEQRWNQAMCSA